MTNACFFKGQKCPFFFLNGERKKTGQSSIPPINYTVILQIIYWRNELRNIKELFFKVSSNVPNRKTRLERQYVPRN